MVDLEKNRLKCVKLLWGIEVTLALFELRHTAQYHRWPTLRQIQPTSLVNLEY